MKREVIFLILLFVIISCVPKADYEKLENENNDLRQELSDVKQQYEILFEEKRQAEIEKNRKPYISETKARELLKDYYRFYNNGWSYRNPVFRRLDNNSFKISLEVCVNKEQFINNEFFWNSEVRTLTVNNDGTYVME